MLQTLDVTQHDNGQIEVRISTWPVGEEPIVTVLHLVETTADSLPLTAEIESLLGTAELIRDEYTLYARAMVAAGYRRWMPFGTWQTCTGPNVPDSMSWRHAATEIASALGPSFRPSIGSRWVVAS